MYNEIVVDWIFQKLDEAASQNKKCKNQKTLLKLNEALYITDACRGYQVMARKNIWLSSELFSLSINIFLVAERNH